MSQGSQGIFVSNISSHCCSAGDRMKGLNLLSDIGFGVLCTKLINFIKKMESLPNV